MFPLTHQRLNYFVAVPYILNPILLSIPERSMYLYAESFFEATFGFSRFCPA